MKEPGFLTLLKPTRTNWSMLLFIAVNLLIFIAMLISGVSVFEPDNESLINCGANFRPSTTAAEWWRLVTSCFLHIGIFHLLLNMYALWYIGYLLEPLIGGIRFAGTYILTGIMASIASIWWNELVISAGASGAIFGLYGVFITLLVGGVVDKGIRKDLLTSMLLFVGYNLVFGIKDGIDNAAHIGGLIAGLLLGLAFLPALKNPEATTLKYFSLAIALLTVIITGVWAMGSIRNDLPTYQAEMEHFQDLESMALDVYKMPVSADKKIVLEEIQDRGIYYWKECIKLVKGMEPLSLPKEIKEQNKKLVQYCEMRIESYQLLYRKIEEDSDLYDKELEKSDQKIEAIMKAMTKSS